MDPLTHTFLPLLVVYVMRPEFFSSTPKFLVAGFGLLSDFDKFLGVPGLLHSLLALWPLVLAFGIVEWRTRKRLAVTTIVGVFLLSHLVLDVLDGGPVPLFYPMSKTGLGFFYPSRVVFGTGPFGLSIEGPIFSFRASSPRSGFNSYGFINGFGVASVLSFALVYLGVNKRS